MNRRTWLGTLALAAASSRTSAACSGRTPDESLPPEIAKVRVTRVTGFRMSSPRPKLVGKNARLDVHGDHTTDDVLRILTDAGVEGLGVGRIDESRARQVVGKRLDELWKPGVGSIGPLARADHALFDLVGRLLNQPAWKLLGGEGPDSVNVYDGSIYFNDLLPEYSASRERGISRILEEVTAARERGHTAFKIKIGRGHKWMDPREGTDRDVQVVEAIRRHVGPEVRLMVDGNNGFTPESAREVAHRMRDFNLIWYEEMFPESVEADRAFGRFLKEDMQLTLVADGESAGEVAHFDPYLATGTLDVLQPDIRAFGLSLQWQLARNLKPPARVWLAPHNWGSHLGLYMQAQLARGLSSVLCCEQDTARCELFDASAYSFKNGRLHVPETPGCGLTIREDLYEREFAPKAWVVKSS
jgi:L-alanine-DL-glutamate epimerase-like enolase superfamily enzyme